MKAVNIEKCFTHFADTYSPKIVGELNGQQVKLVRLEGDKCPWHIHAGEDELFYVLEGQLEIHEPGEMLTLGPGEFYIVPRGRKHRVVPHGHVKLLLFEPEGIAHTGDVHAEITLESYERLDTGS
jgi:mannose-6-phosphate isomerase-like protein (cupin superfamily)